MLLNLNPPRLPLTKNFKRTHKYPSLARRRMTEDSIMPLETRFQEAEGSRPIPKTQAGMGELPLISLGSLMPCITHLLDLSNKRFY